LIGGRTTEDTTEPIVDVERKLTEIGDALEPSYGIAVFYPSGRAAYSCRSTSSAE
jgi:hypothetical protein